MNKATGKLEIDPETAPYVRELFSRYADGERLTVLQAEMEQRGLRSKRKLGCKKKAIRKDRIALLLMIPGIRRTDLYCRMDAIPFDTMRRFFENYLG